MSVETHWNIAPCVLYGRSCAGLMELVSYWGQGRMMVTKGIIMTLTFTGCVGRARHRSQSYLRIYVFHPHIKYYY